MDNPTAGSSTWDVVDQASFESFPASDPPGWGSSHASALELDDLRPRVLVLASSHRITQFVATAIQTTFATRGICAELADAASHPPPPADYDAVVIGLAVGRRDRSVESYLKWFRSGLAELPAAVFVVGSVRRCDRALRASLLEAPCAMAAFATPSWPWQRWLVDGSCITRFVDDVTEALPGGRDGR